MRFLAVLFVLVFSQPLAAAEQERELTVGGHVALATLRTPEPMTAETPLVVMTHGTLAHKDMETIRGLAKLLQERGIATLAHNLTLGLDRRKGMFDCAQKHDYLTSDAVAEIGAWIAEAGKSSRRIYALGHSRGANQVARYLTAGSDAVRAAVLLAPATRATEIDLRAAYAKTYGAPLSPLLDQASGAVGAGRGGEWINVPGFIYCRDAVVTPRAFLSFYRDDPLQDTAALVATLKLPVLVLAGAKDTTVPDVLPSFGPLLAGQSSNIRIATIDDADHFFRDLAAEDAADRIAEFVKQTP